MKDYRMSLVLAATCSSITFLAVHCSGAIVFTSDALIAPANTNYDGADIIVTNCTLTVDGPHSFTSVQVQSGGILTHSAGTNGWVDNPILVANESHVLNGTNAVSLLHSNVAASSVLVHGATNSISYTNGADFELVLLTNGLSTLARTESSSIPDGSEVLLDYEAVGDPVAAGLTLTIDTDFLVEADGAVKCDAKGFAGGQGSGKGNSFGYPLSGAGAGYGGLGGHSSSNAVGGLSYDFPASPNSIGSGGGSGYQGPGGSGGGLVKVTVLGELLLDGTLSVNGANGLSSRSGGGSGGGVRLDVGMLSGQGQILANGGNGEPRHGGGGGGGRVAIQTATNLFAGSMHAHGGAGAEAGGAGTISISDAGYHDRMLVDNGGNLGAVTPVLAIASELVVSGGARLGASSYYSGLSSLTIGSNSWILAPSNASFSMSVSGDVTIEAGGGITADGRGYPAQAGPGAGRSYYVSFGQYFGGGGGHGGVGADSDASDWDWPGIGAGGSSYGDVSGTVDRGSGGGGPAGSSCAGGSGGGAIQLSVSGTLLLGGEIRANGLPGIGPGGDIGPGGGGGSGGGVWLTVGRFEGTGSVLAEGGKGSAAGGGGAGGRITVQVNSSANGFTGILSARGGIGGRMIAGGAGTVFMRVRGQHEQLVVDNGGRFGAETPVTSVGTLDLVISGGARFTTSPYASVRNLLIRSDGWILTSSNPSFTMNASGNVTIEGGGGILANGAGYSAYAGPSYGRYASSNGVYSGGGGSHGGYGTASGGSALGGPTVYDYANTPTDGGSGGGGPPNSSYAGGRGGGAVRLTVAQTLVLDGEISADGQGGQGEGGGGGAGGSVYVTTGQMQGAGVISASGGAGNGLGGGGGGGRIAVIVNSPTNGFTGALTAHGGVGGGTTAGGAGTVYTTVLGQPAQLLVDNGGNAGPATLVPSLPLHSLVIAGGARLMTLAPFYPSLGDLVIRSNSWLVGPSNLSFSVSASGNVTIDAGGGIMADGAGYPAQQGPGAGRYYFYSGVFYGGGGGYGGLGADSLATNGLVGAGGSSYGSITSPVDRGSGGGSPYAGGSGGGAVRLTVNGALLLNGRISANGQAGQGAGGGGGSGGSVWLTVGEFDGTGTISANGGDGNDTGGGGGGGRIAVQVNGHTNGFGGVLSAHGGIGSGMFAGGAGTVYVSDGGRQNRLVVDNGGHAGALTRAASVLPHDLVISGGARFTTAYFNTPVYPGVGDLIIQSNSWFIAPTNVPFLLLASGSVMIDAGGGIVADGLGYPAQQGPGAGRNSYYYNGISYGGGGGHGGLGADSIAPNGNMGTGGLSYDSATSPSATGSGGGGLYQSQYGIGGGNGGGSIRLSVGQTLVLDGEISANGLSGQSSSGGGGAGGSVYLTTREFQGSGVVSANGGDGNDLGGGGAGGRIAIYVNINRSTNAFTGTVMAHGGGGGGGYTHGGAGTVYTKLGGKSTGQLLVENGGFPGANTPVSSISFADLVVKSGGYAESSENELVLHSLTLGDGGWLLGGSGKTNLDLLVLGDVEMEAGGGIVLDGQGYQAYGSGPGGGLSSLYTGSGAGHGGPGGASMYALGGSSYGSAERPVLLGSCGGAGYMPALFGSEGGGALRLNVAGTCSLVGQVSANGNYGFEDDAGGGSGGSIWITAGGLTGNGSVAADGGDGELYGGGGGAGGRIALYSPSNSFDGTVSAIGGDGYEPGGNGSVFQSSAFPGFAAESHSPAGSVGYAVGSWNVFFSNPPDPGTATASDIQITTPAGDIPEADIFVSSAGNYALRFSFPSQTVPGEYRFVVGPDILDLWGQPMSQSYTGAFTLVTSFIQGAATNLAGAPVAGVVLTNDIGLASVTTDADGHYALEVSPGATFTLTPAADGMVVIPSLRSYVNISNTRSNQDYLVVESVVPEMALSLGATNVVMSWTSIPGVEYQPLFSTNLTDWAPYGVPINGDGQVYVLELQPDPAPVGFWKLQAGY